MAAAFFLTGWLGEADGRMDSPEPPPAPGHPEMDASVASVSRPVPPGRGLDRGGRTRVLYCVIILLEWTGAANLRCHVLVDS